MKKMFTHLPSCLSLDLFQNRTKQKSWNLLYLKSSKGASKLKELNQFEVV